jgi:NADH-quinone oxidoreductase subunit H
MLKIIVNYFIFPGFLFVAVAGMLVSWIDRKVTARVQWRVGPPLLQPFYDLRKLFFKQTILPAEGGMLFVLAPIMAVVAIVLAFDILLTAWLYPWYGFVGDIIAIVSLLMMPALVSVLDASSSHNPLASLGARREMKLLFSYELPFILSLLVAVLKTGSVTLGGIITHQQRLGSVAGSISGFLALAVGVLCLQAQLGLVPFDSSEAETEIASGTLIEYSGKLLALWKLGKMMMMVVGPLLLVIVFWAKGSTGLLAAKYVALLVVAILIRNTNPRVRIDQAVRFFWGPVLFAAVTAVIVALSGY